MKKITLVIIILVLIWCMLVNCVFLVSDNNDNNNKLLVSYSDYIQSYEIYEDGTIKYYTDVNSDESFGEKIIEKAEVENIKKLISTRATDEIALNEDVAKNEEIYNQEWVAEVYYNGSVISLNYNNAESNKNLQNYIDMLGNKYVVESDLTK